MNDRDGTMTSSPAPIPSEHEREVERSRARRRGDACGGADRGGERLLEARRRGDPARPNPTPPPRPRPGLLGPECRASSPGCDSARRGDLCRRHCCGHAVTACRALLRQALLRWALLHRVSLARTPPSSRAGQPVFELHLGLEAEDGSRPRAGRRPAAAPGSRHAPGRNSGSRSLPMTRSSASAELGAGSSRRRSRR